MAAVQIRVDYTMCQGWSNSWKLSEMTMAKFCLRPSSDGWCAIQSWVYNVSELGYHQTLRCSPGSRHILELRHSLGVGHRPEFRPSTKIGHRPPTMVPLVGDRTCPDCRHLSENTLWQKVGCPQKIAIAIEENELCEDISTWQFPDDRADHFRHWSSAWHVLKKRFSIEMWGCLNTAHTGATTRICDNVFVGRFSI